MNKEKVRELKEFMRNNTSFTIEDYEKRITEWLEQNTFEPVVVGLSDEQVEDLASDLDSWNIGDTDGFIFHIKEWLKAQTFVQPESKEVVVGLSDEQVKDFSRLYGLTATQQNRLNANLTDFLKTQTFTQCRAFDDSELSEKYMTLYDDYQSLLIDLSLQRFEPDWDDAPTEAVLWRTCFEWLNENHNVVRSDVLQPEINRPNPTQQVEVGQVWKCAKTEVIVIALNDDDVVFQKVITKGFNVYSIIDFLAKFERDMTPRHTPAPWSIEFGIRSAVILDVATNEIAVVEIGIHDEETEAELRANAKLIAAAPDLLAALIACDEAMEYISEYDIPLTLPQQVKDAIARATT